MFSLYAVRNAAVIALAAFGYLAVAHLAHGAELPEMAPGIHVYESDCKVRPLEQGGGNVRECKVRIVRVASKPVARIGKTTVKHLGARVVYMQPLVVHAGMRVASR